MDESSIESKPLATPRDVNITKIAIKHDEKTTEENLSVFTELSTQGNAASHKATVQGRSRYVMIRIHAMFPNM